jgi:hypothetical protein
MGEVYRPKGFEKKKPIPDLEREPSPRPTHPVSPASLLEEIRVLRLEIERIKKALRRHGIPIEPDQV